MNPLPAEKGHDNTNSSLLERIKHLSDAPSWARFYDVYAPLIERIAARYGLSPQERKEAVQNTMLRITRKMTQYERTKGSFKSWLCQCAKWRILELIRARPRNIVSIQRDLPSPADSSHEPWEPAFEKDWEADWEAQLKRSALEEVKKKVSAKHFQIFYLHVVEGFTPAKVAAMVGVRIAQVHLIKFRLGRIAKRELAGLRSI